MLAATVLVADDDADILRFVEINLRLEGLEVVTARDGRDALAKAAAVRPDLVLVDVQMPGIDGYTICARIRADASLAAVRVIIVTANYGSAAVEAARRAGADDFLVKPFLPATLLDLAKAMLSEAATASPHLPAACPSGEWCGRDLGARRGSRVVGRLGHSVRHSTGRNQTKPLVTSRTRHPTWPARTLLVRPGRMVRSLLVNSRLGVRVPPPAPRSADQASAGSPMRSPPSCRRRGASMHW